MGWSNGAKSTLQWADGDSLPTRYSFAKMTQVNDRDKNQAKYR